VRWRKVYLLKKVVYFCNLSHWDLPSCNALFHAFDSVWKPSTSRGASRWIQRKIFLKLWFLCSATKIRIWMTLEFSSYSFIPPQTTWTFLVLFTSKLLFKVSYMLVNSYLMACSRLSHMHPLKELVTFTSVYQVLLHGTLLGRIPNKMEVFFNWI
jgi:hypothetical protein